MLRDTSQKLLSLPINALANALIFVYSAFISIVWPFAFALTRLFPKVSKQFEGRQNLKTLTPVLARERNRKQDACLFFCSSAGEFEQAKPLIDKLVAKDIFVHTVFFSRSGFDFAHARGESLSFSLAPPDSVWNWGWLFSAVRPSTVFVIRHELWPAFLVTARFWGKLYLVNANILHTPRNQFKRRVKTFLLNKFDHIFVVAERDQKRLIDDYRLSDNNISVVGDTKYDRVFERVKENSSKDEPLARQLRHLANGRRILIVGSAHQPDVSMVAKAYQLMPQNCRERWSIVFVPHYVNKSHVQKLMKSAADLGLLCSIYSDENRELINELPVSAPTDCLFFDVMGKLAELYSLADAAVVGGAWHHQVHNVLEPACYGLPLAYGPQHETSHEAIALIEQGIADVVVDEHQLAHWWQKVGLDEIDNSTRKQKVATWCGATNKIFGFIGTYDGQTINC